ncbi:MAG: hypothetical protein A2Y12_08890 [Planctomycetes bacterium GWF2_42_9]|nr:MAG: hypothetical protein A2Y12_08890 [Planctomycetes bacterium GWF2_42_9]HAL44595.1 hypothetical protein [Phycisphaerales bacterium]
MSLYRYIFVLLVVFVVTISVVYLRRTENCEFYKFRLSQMKTIRLKQQLWQKQLQLENYVSPSAVSKVVKEQETNKQN